MYRHGIVINEKSRKLLTSALIQCHFDYAASAWYLGISKKLKLKLQIVQNKVVRFILNIGPRTHIGQCELNKVGILNTSDRVSQLMLNHMYNVYNGTAPEYLCNNFTRLNTQHSHCTRNSEHNFVLPMVHGVAKSIFFYNGVKIWNELPDSVKCLTSKHDFKQNVKFFLKNRTLAEEGSSFLYY